MTELLNSLGEVPSWQDLAACRGMDPEIFFPHRGTDTRAPKAICNRCPVRPDCLEFAMDNGERWGIWGGVSERGRREIRRPAIERHRLVYPEVDSPVEKVVDVLQRIARRFT